MLEAEREATTAAMSNTQEDLSQLRATIAAEKRNHIDVMERKDEGFAR
jgi:septal ring factor EnvC (AmiA/AmiB activator)